MDNNGHVLVSSIVELSSVLFTLTAASPDVATATVYEAQSEYVRVRWKPTTKLPFFPVLSSNPLLPPLPSPIQQ